jgi:hypothetical protein
LDDKKDTEVQEAEKETDVTDDARNATMERKKNKGERRDSKEDDTKDKRPQKRNLEMTKKVAVNKVKEHMMEPIKNSAKVSSVTISFI